VSPPFPIRIGRVYDHRAEAGARILVDRLWPRGVTKAALALDAWPKDVTPSTELRKWFHADPSRWPEFCERYRAELAARPEAVATCLGWCRKGPVVLLTAARDPGRSQAAVLREVLGERLVEQA
jgi:uncharacterized protein YeaO (DUF488 family)